MTETEGRIKVGVTGRAHGIGGAVRVFPEDEDSVTLARIKMVYLGETQKPYKVLRSQKCTRFFALTLEGVSDRDAAFALTGQDVYIDRSALKPLKDAYYVCDLVGLELVGTDGRTYGRVKSVMPSGAHELLCYGRTNGHGSGFVPFVDEYVGKVDMEAGQIEVDGEWMAQIDAVYDEEA